MNSSVNLGRGGRRRLLPPCVTRRNCVNFLGYMECKGDKWIEKRKEVVDIFRKGKFELFALIETKLKGNAKVSWSGVNGIISVQEIESLGKVWPF